MKKKSRFEIFLKKNWLILLIILIVSGLFIYSYYSKGIIYSLSNSDSQSVVDFVNSFGAFSYFVFVVIVVLEVVLAQYLLLHYTLQGALFGAFLEGY